jgi:hypothetical protein
LIKKQLFFDAQQPFDETHAHFSDRRAAPVDGTATLSIRYE